MATRDLSDRSRISGDVSTHEKSQVTAIVAPAQLPCLGIESCAKRRQNSTLRVMVKPLTGGDFEQYLCLVPRDRREAIQ
jgi:hypothetical protein